MFVLRCVLLLFQIRLLLFPKGFQASSSEASDQVELHRQMSSIAFQYRRTIVAKRKRKTEAFAMVSEIKKIAFPSAAIETNRLSRTKPNPIEKRQQGI
jgi:hypothetical protein